MKKMILISAALLLAIFANINVQAQTGDKKEEPKPPETTTIDAWRTAFPAGEQPGFITPAAAEEVRTTSEVTESPAQVKKRIAVLEQNLMEALKQRDSNTLKNLLGDDFVSAGVNIPGVTVSGPPVNKGGYIDWAMKNLELKSYKFEKATVQIYPQTAVVTFNYNRQAVIGGAPSDGNFVVTDVWVKRGDQWQAVSHHISQLPNAGQPAK